MQRSSSVWLSLSKLSTLILCVLIFSTLSFAAAPDRIIGPIVSDRLIKLTAGVPMKAQPQFDRGPVDPSLKLGYMTLLTAPSATQQKAIDRLLAQQQDPHSPLYHKWLTPEQYAERFGLSPNDIQKLTAWLQSHGFAIISVARARNFIVFNGTAAQAESAFQTQIHNFEADGEKHFSNTTPISIPAALSGIVTGVRGLSNFRPKSHAHHAKLGVAKPDYTTSGGYLYIAPGDIATIYDLQPLYTAGIDGAGQTLAVMGQTDVYLADLNDFRSGFELPAISGCTTNPNLVITACDTTNFKYVLVNSDPGTPSTSDLPEADIDLEWSNAVARNAQIIYVNAPYRNGNGTWDSWYYAVDQDVAPVITLSYGLCELEEAYYGGSSGEGSFTSDEAELTEANLEGITFMNSSGDSGAAQCDYSESPAVYGYAVGYPASSPEVTGVGGTLIPYTDETSTYWSATNSTTGGSAISYIPEEAWNDEQEIGEFCVAYPTNSFCTGNGITSWETAQSAIGIWAGGGGLSNCVTETGGVCATPPNGGFPQPAWQSGLSLSDLGQTAAVRFSPDVSLLASIYWPGYILCTAAEEVGGTGTTSSCAPGGAQGIINDQTIYGYSWGGTSVATPIFAGIVTLLNQYFGTDGLGNINPTLYSLAATPSNGAFHPVEIGSNGAYCSPGTPSDEPEALQCPSSGANAGFLGFDASNYDSTTGYNLVTGLGSVDANNLAQSWLKLIPPSFTLAVTATPNTTVTGQNVQWSGTLRAVNDYDSAVTLSCTTGAPATCTIDPSTLTPTAGGASFTVTAGSSTAATYTFSIQGTDGTITKSQAVSLTVKPDFTVPATLTAPTAANPGQSTSTTMSISPGGSTFISNVTYTCSGLPAGATCSFSPTQINAGGSATTVTITVETTGPFTGSASGNVRRNLLSQNQRLWLPLSLPLAGMLLVGLTGRGVPRHCKIAGLCLTLTVAAFLAACGGGSTSPQVASVSVSPGSVNSLYPSLTGAPAQTQQFTATVTPSAADQNVTWAVSGTGNGTITATGLYTAPATLPNPNSAITITATSVADTSKSNTATVSLLQPTPAGTYPITVNVTDGSLSQTATFNLTVN